MRKIKLIPIIVLNLMWFVWARVASHAATSVSQYGITWTFDRDYPVGQFANGDYWVVGPVTITVIDPAPVASVTDGRNGTVINPRFATEQGYDSRGAAYDVSLCKVPPFIANLGDSILSSISFAEIYGKTYVRTIAVLTVVDTSQASDKFRPPYTRPVREPVSAQDELIFSTDDIQWQYLKQLEPVSSTPNLAYTEREFERIRLEHFQGWTATTINPADNGSNYGREVSGDVSEASLQLCLNYTNEEKRTLMIRFLQFGIDLYGVYLDGGEWHADGGIFCGRKWPLLFAGIMLNNEIKNIDMPTERFHEDGQTFYVTRHPDGDNAPPGNEDYDIYTPPYRLRQYGWSGNNYEIGTVKMTNGSYIVEGVGTSWAASDKVGVDYSFGVHNDVEAYKIDGKAYRIAGVIDETHLRLTEPYRGETNITGNATYIINPVLVKYGHGNGGKDADFVEYTAEHEGMPEWGIVHVRDTSFDGLDWDTNYRQCCNANAWSGFVLVARIMEEDTQSMTIWNHSALFDYQDRYMQVELEDSGKGHWTRGYSDFIEDMWDTYRADYAPVWSGELFYLVQDSRSAPHSDAVDDGGTDDQSGTDDNGGNIDTDMEKADISVEKTLLSVYNNIIKSGSLSEAIIYCDMKESGKLTVKIYNSKGTEVATLFNGQATVGRHEFRWTGANFGSGIYMVHMNVGNYSETKKIAVVK